MVRSSCSVCDHPSAEVISAALASGSLSQRIIASRYGISRTTLGRHKKNCLERDEDGNLSVPRDINVESALEHLEKEMEEKRKNQRYRGKKTMVELFRDTSNLMSEGEENPLTYMVAIAAEVQNGARRDGNGRLTLESNKQMADLVRIRLEMMAEAREQARFEDDDDRKSWGVTQGYILRFLDCAGLTDKFMDGLAALEDNPKDMAGDIAKKALAGDFEGYIEAQSKKEVRTGTTDVKLKHPEYGPSKFSAEKEKTHPQPVELSTG